VLLDKSKIEQETDCQELVFSDSLLLYQRHFCYEALKHPAKCNLYLLSHLVTNYTKEGDTILDCCAGTGSTGLIAGLFGRKSILIDIEPRYVKWITETFSKTKFKPIILLGDARRLRQGLKTVGNPKINAVIFSPPYADMLRGVEMIEGGYSYGKAQIGRMAFAEHLVEVEKIYRECHAVLENGQKMMVIVRNYVRQGGVVDLTFETYNLCMKVGFKLVKALKLRLPKIRAELIEYYKSHPLTPRVLHEYVLIFEK
jgi:DNA modification methylase